MFDRIELLIGKENLEKLNSTNILIVGIGGVGGFVLETIIRSGIGNITIVDGDVVDISNLNRQVISNTSNIGLEKVNVAINRCMSINPNCNVVAKNEFINQDNINNYKGFDYIIDACDDVAAKVLLIKYALDNNIKIISCMGTGKRINPGDVLLSTLDKTYNDPLAKVMRNRLKKENISTKIPVVFSKELPLNNEKTIASCMIVPCTAAMHIAYYVINDIIKK